MNVEELCEMRAMEQREALLLAAVAVFLLA
jgi:hypothetical protein